VTIRLPAAPTGRALSVVSYGAIPGRNSDDASAAFRRAINAARSGDEILVPKGSYVFKRPNVVLKSGVGCAARAGR
jgi:polygalacturonase